MSVISQLLTTPVLYDYRIPAFLLSCIKFKTLSDEWGLKAIEKLQSRSINKLQNGAIPSLDLSPSWA